MRPCEHDRTLPFACLAKALAGLLKADMAFTWQESKYQTPLLVLTNCSSWDGDSCFTGQASTCPQHTLGWHRGKGTGRQQTVFSRHSIYCCLKNFWLHPQVPSAPWFHMLMPPLCLSSVSLLVLLVSLLCVCGHPGSDTLAWLRRCALLQIPSCPSPLTLLISQTQKE